MNTNTKQLNWIQGLRGMAVLLVMFCHARYFFLGTSQWELAQLLMLPGAMGVDLFFIVSGFIMVHATSSSDLGPTYVARFAIKRFSRIWPAYAIATVIWVWVNGNGVAYFQDNANLAQLARSLAVLPAVPNESLFFKMALPLGWTLVFEMYFYAVFAISMLFGTWRWMVLCTWALLTIIAIPLAFGHFTLQVHEAQNFSFGYLAVMTNPIILEFIAGVGIGLLFMNKTVRIASSVLCANLVFLTIGLVLWYAYGGIGSFHGPLNWGWPLALMVLAMAIASKTIDLTPPRILCWLGAISYSLYLTHMTTQLVLTNALTKYGYDMHTWATVFITTVVAICVAALSYTYIEQALSHWVRQRLLGLLVPPHRIQPVVLGTKQDALTM